MGKIYDTEELILEVKKDVSNNSIIKDNSFKIRVIRRTKIKHTNFFRKKEKVNVYYDIEFIKPCIVSNNDKFPFTSSERMEIKKENKNIKEYNNYISKIFEEQIWDAENFCINRKNEKKEKGIIRIKSLCYY